MQRMDDLQFFNPRDEHSIAVKSLPHWSQAGTICFITWRTADSLPQAVIAQLADARRELLKSSGLNPDTNWRRDLNKLPPADRGRMQWSLFTAWDGRLDHGAGECLLSRPDLSSIVSDCLLNFDGVRYELTDFVVMPNHVHVLVAFHDEQMLLDQCRSWKRFTARHINSALGRRGPFWQVEQFDHLVRSETDFARYRRYIAENPTKCRLPPSSYRHYTRPPLP
jgi:REP element-mobilizing transposase RayT